MLTLTALLLVTLFVYTVLLLFVHQSGVLIASLAVNVNVKLPLVHAASAMLHVGPVVSNLYVPFHVFVFHAASHTHKYNV